MAEYVNPYMYLDDVTIEVEKVVSMAMSAGSYSAAEHYLVALLWHMEMTGDAFLKRQIQNIRTFYNLKPFSTPPVAPDMLPLGVEPKNMIFVTTFSYKMPEGEREFRLSMSLLLKWIKRNFLPRVSKKYDWFALWRLLKDKNLLSDTKISRFEEQMNLWFPSEVIPAVADAINLYKNGYLGDNPYYDWNKQEFLERRPNVKQTEEGYDRLVLLCYSLAGAFIPSNLELKEDRKNTQETATR